MNVNRAIGVLSVGTGSVVMLLLSLIVVDKQAGAAADNPKSVEEIRYCGAPPRDAHGKIIRSKTAIAAFMRNHPCPSSGKTSGACSGWAIDHVVPMACGGCDAVYNMQWLPNEIKSAAGEYAKDRWERQVYGNPNVYEAPNCNPLARGGIQFGK